MSDNLQPIESDSIPYYARPKDGGEHYFWEGTKLRRVTSILGEAPGQFLMSWAASQAAMKCASHLYEAGLIQIPPADVKLQEFCMGKTPRCITPEQAYVEILAWQMNMKESERYRDYKARIGSVTHHAVYRHALGDRIPASDLVEYLANIVDELQLFKDPSRPDWEPTQAMVDTIAHASHSYVLSAIDWIEKAQPEFEEIGLESAVIHMPTYDEDGIDNMDGYAGTTDAKFKLKKSVIEKNFAGNEFPWLWEAQEIEPRADFKTSNTLSKSVQMQIEAYDRADDIGIMATGEQIPIERSDVIGALHIGPHPSMSLVTDEFGTLESRAKQIGTKFHTWPSSDVTWGAFLGLCKFANWMHDVPRSQQQRPKSAPKPEKLPKDAKRSVPF